MGGGSPGGGGGNMSIEGGGIRGIDLLGEAISRVRGGDHVIHFASERIFML